jgi:hypothetical protein
MIHFLRTCAHYRTQAKPRRDSFPVLPAGYAIRIGTGTRRPETKWQNPLKEDNL